MLETSPYHASPSPVIRHTRQMTRTTPTPVWSADPDQNISCLCNLQATFLFAPPSPAWKRSGFFERLRRQKREECDQRGVFQED